MGRINIAAFLICIAEHQWTVADLARAADVDRRTVSRIREGKPVKLRTIGKLAEALNCDVSKLLEVGTW